MVWDEGDAIVRAEQIPWAWPYTIEQEGHPAFFGIVMRLGHLLGSAWLPPLVAWRLGPMLLFAAAAGVVYYRMARDFSTVAAVGAVAAMLFMPRLFAHVHFASFDGPLVSCWLLAWAAFAAMLKGADGDIAKDVTSPHPQPRSHGTLHGPTAPCSVLWERGALFGLALGMTMSCKATGWLAPLPFLLWAVIYSRPILRRTVFISLPVALLTFVVLNPPLWSNPISGLMTFLQLNFNRAANPGLNVATQFFGQLYDLHHSLPWYNTLVWTAITVPVGLLALATVGIVSVCRVGRAERAPPMNNGGARRPTPTMHAWCPVGARRPPLQSTLGILILLDWLTLIVVRALPGMPPHDAERLILPSFAFLALLCGIGCHLVWHGSWLGSNSTNPHPQPRPLRGARRKRARGALVLAIYLGSATSLVWYAPQWLSYYNLLVGGLPGATAVGMEPTYYWDGLDGDVLAWLHEHTADDEKIHFAAAPEDNLALMHRWGMLRRGTRADDPGVFRWVVVQRRPSGLQPPEARLVAHATPAYQKLIRRGGRGPWRLDVPIVEVYEYSDWKQAREDNEDVPRTASCGAVVRSFLLVQPSAVGNGGRGKPRGTPLS